MPSVLAAKAFLKVDTQNIKATANIIPVWNIKYQADTGIISPFNAEHVGNGVTMAFHSSAPLEALVLARQGELDIVLKSPQQILSRGRSVETIHGFVQPYTVRSPLSSIEPLNKAQDLKEILTGEPLKRVSFYVYIKSFFNYGTKIGL